MSKTIPNVFMYWCQHKARCKWCGEYVVAGTPIIQVYYWNKGNEENRKWNIKRFYHPKCYIDQGLDYLMMNPYVPYLRKPKSKLSEEDRTERYRLLRLKASIDQRKRSLRSDYPDRILDEARLDKQVSDLMIRIVKIGGVPKKWLS